MSGTAKHQCVTAGEQYGRWTVLSWAWNDQYHRAFWNCKCSCGVERAASSNSLKNGDSQSCGCLWREHQGARAQHGHARRSGRTPTFQSWQNMIARCTNPSYPKFKNYGGRGINVCEQWLTSFGQFLADMGEQPAGLTLDRFPNRDGDYEPGNCRWASYAEQNRNRRGNRFLTANGETLVLADWAHRLNTDAMTIHGRLRRGWPVEQAVTVPVGQKRDFPTQEVPTVEV